MSACSCLRSWISRKRGQGQTEIAVCKVSVRYRETLDTKQVSELVADFLAGLDSCSTVGLFDSDGDGQDKKVGVKR
jgi:hypothetical protein